MPIRREKIPIEDEEARLLSDGIGALAQSRAQVVGPFVCQGHGDEAGGDAHQQADGDPHEAGRWAAAGVARAEAGEGEGDGASSDGPRC